MSAELTKEDPTILEHYAKESNREISFYYMAQTEGSDGYGLPALGVVRNDKVPGAIANSLAARQVQR